MILLWLVFEYGIIIIAVGLILIVRKTCIDTYRKICNIVKSVSLQQFTENKSTTAIRSKPYFLLMLTKLTV